MALDTTIGGTASNSYLTLQEWIEYWSPLGVDLLQQGHTSAHEGNLRRAVQWIDREFVFVGQKQYQFQALAWPRLTGYGFLVDGWPVDPDTIPQDIKNAQAEMAYLIHQGADPFATVTGGAIKMTRSKAGPVEAETEYANPTMQAKYVAVLTSLKRYLAAGASGGQVRMLRA